VSQLFREGQHDRIFKGKWYALILSHHIKALMGAQPYDAQYVQQKLFGNLPLTLNYDADWSNYLRTRIEAVLP